MRYFLYRRILLHRLIGRWYFCIHWRRPTDWKFMLHWRRSPDNAYSASVLDLGALHFIGGCIH